MIKIQESLKINTRREDNPDSSLYYTKGSLLPLFVVNTFMTIYKMIYASEIIEAIKHVQFLPI